jgi:FixJ family two-component response regulator
VEIALNSEHAIAIIDDSSSVRRALESLLRSLGFVVLSFESAEAFLTSPVVRETSCVVTDVEMPGLTGIDLYERMRSDKNQTPVIFITANSEQAVRSRRTRRLHQPGHRGAIAALLFRRFMAPIPQ